MPTGIRIEVSADEYQLIREAAARRGQKIKHFATEAVVAEARRALAQPRTPPVGELRTVRVTGIDPKTGAYLFEEELPAQPAQWPEHLKSAPEAP